MCFGGIGVGFRDEEHKTIIESLGLTPSQLKRMTHFERESLMRRMFLERVLTGEVLNWFWVVL